MHFGSHFELALEQIPQGGFYGTLDMLLPDVYCFICQKSSHFRVGACNLLQGLHYTCIYLQTFNSGYKRGGVKKCMGSWCKLCSSASEKYFPIRCGPEAS